MPSLVDPLARGAGSGTQRVHELLATRESAPIIGDEPVPDPLHDVPVNVAESPRVVLNLGASGLGNPLGRGADPIRVRETHGIISAPPGRLGPTAGHVLPLSLGRQAPAEAVEAVGPQRLDASCCILERVSRTGRVGVTHLQPADRLGQGIGIGHCLEPVHLLHRAACAPMPGGVGQAERFPGSLGRLGLAHQQGARDAHRMLGLALGHSSGLTIGRAHLELAGRGAAHAFAPGLGLLVHLAVAVVVEAIALLQGERSATATSVGHALVDLTVAVIVDRVADLVRGRTGNSVAGGAQAIARAHLLPLGQAGALTRGAGDVDGKAVVGRAIAVLVHAIALFGPGADLADTRAEAPVDAGLRPGPTQAHALRSGQAGVAGLLERGVVPRLVDIAVAVVVESVAGLDQAVSGLGRATRAPIGVTLDHAFGAAGTGANEAGLAEAKPVVSHAVAVIIQAIAGLGGGADLLHALGVTPERILADLDSGLAFAAIRSPRGPVITWALHPGGAGADEAGRGVGLVDLAVAVIVRAVAGFGLGSGALGPNAVQPAGQALDHAIPADAGVTRVTGNPDAEDVFVDVAIAVIVEAIAGLGDGGDLTHAGAEAPIFAGAIPPPALSDPHRIRGVGVAGLGDRQAVHEVDVAIAVVVGVVADFVLGLDGDEEIAEAFPILTAPPEPGAFADPEARAATAAQTKVFVGLSVTVVVEAVARLGPGHAGRAPGPALTTGPAVAAIATRSTGSIAARVRGGVDVHPDVCRSRVGIRVSRWDDCVHRLPIGHRQTHIDPDVLRRGVRVVLGVRRRVRPRVRGRDGCIAVGAVAPTRGAVRGRAIAIQGVLVVLGDTDARPEHAPFVQGTVPRTGAVSGQVGVAPQRGQGHQGPPGVSHRHLPPQSGKGEPSPFLTNS